MQEIIDNWDLFRRENGIYRKILLIFPNKNKKTSNIINIFNWNQNQTMCKFTSRWYIEFWLLLRSRAETELHSCNEFRFYLLENCLLSSNQSWIYHRDIMQSITYSAGITNKPHILIKSIVNWIIPDNNKKTHKQSRSIQTFPITFY